MTFQEENVTHQAIIDREERPYKTPQDKRKGQDKSRLPVP